MHGTPCGEDCLTLTWPNGKVSTTSLTIAIDYAALCGCSIVMLAPAASTVDSASRNTLREQQIAAWTEIYVTQVEAQGPVLPGRTSALDAVDAAAHDALREQQIAAWTEIYVTQLEAPGH